jgi:hypothetical protein
MASEPRGKAVCPALDSASAFDTAEKENLFFTREPLLDAK